MTPRIWFWSVPVICACAQTQDSVRSGNSSAGFAGSLIVSAGSDWPLEGLSSTPGCLRTTTRHSQGRKRPCGSAFAGVKSQGKSGRSNSTAGK
jgi:hypothetical protein